MSLSLNDRVQLANQARAERSISMLREADAKLEEALQWDKCDCETCRKNPYGARLLKAKPVVNRKVLGRVGVLLLAASVLAIFLLLKGLPFLRALNY